MAPVPDPNSVGGGANRDEATTKVPTKDPKKKDVKKKEDLSEEDLQLKQNLELYVERVQDPNPELQKAALESMRQEIRASTSSMTSVPKPLKFLRPHYGTLKEFHEKMAESDLKKLFADILSVLALTMSTEGKRESLGYRLTGTEGDIGSWGHEYVRNLAGEIAEEYTMRQADESSIEDLMDLVKQIVAFHMMHNAETEAVDLLMDVEDLDLLLEHFILFRRERMREKEMKAKQEIYDIFKEFMTGITKLDELGNAASSFLFGFQQGLSLLKRPPVVTSSKLMENLIKNNETRRLKSYIEADCININDAAQSTLALHTSLSGLSNHLIKAKSLLIELGHLTDEAAHAIESATKLSTELETESSDELQHVMSDEEKETVPEVTDYATLIAVVYSMMMQNYSMQEKIVRSLNLKSSAGELETYSLMWSLRPFVEDEIMNRAWKLI